ncbi:hypothetical protein OM076_13650 [Solirubrobacter ginsenosidimutans]|uniref:Uncharacterized protein n=1 Tax=Solirubrobacter ginsenosidimutans TaxID=490573 RepID=A0A9X3MTU1_9ACTN|nr:hypothetical protein [Solirubrobacter ginsenosidimutans]MDA0161317.1 hypothetical protein [Solirubrobacter ginsenosidimutans]
MQQYLAWPIYHRRRQADLTLMQHAKVTPVPPPFEHVPDPATFRHDASPELEGFGGCAGCRADVVRGATPAQLTLAYQVEHTPGYGDLVDRLGDIDYASLLDTIRRHRDTSVPNGLTPEENGQLLGDLPSTFTAELPTLAVARQ